MSLSAWIQPISMHWHFLCGPTTEQSLEFSLTEDYCRNHFLVGLLLREVAEALQQGPDVRQLAVSVLKNLLIKHALDDRYTAYKVRDCTEDLITYRKRFCLLLKLVCLIFFFHHAAQILFLLFILQMPPHSATYLYFMVCMQNINVW